MRPRFATTQIFLHLYEDAKIEVCIFTKIKIQLRNKYIIKFVWYAVIITFFKDDVKDKMNIVRKLTMAIGKARIRYKKCGKISLTA